MKTEIKKEELENIQSIDDMKKLINDYLPKNDLIHQLGTMKGLIQISEAIGTIIKIATIIKNKNALHQSSWHAQFQTKSNQNETPSNESDFVKIMKYGFDTPSEIHIMNNENNDGFIGKITMTKKDIIILYGFNNKLPKDNIYRNRIRIFHFQIDNENKIKDIDELHFPFELLYYTDLIIKLDDQKQLTMYPRKRN